MVERVVLDLAGLAVPAGRLEGAADAGAIDQNALLTVALARLRDDGVDLRFGNDIDPAGDAPDFACRPLAEVRRSGRTAPP
jgi:hypothetical protein